MVVPFGQQVVEADPHGFLEAVGDFLTGGIDLVQNVDQHVQARGGLGFRHVVADLLDRLEDHSLTRAGHMRKSRRAGTQSDCTWRCRADSEPRESPTPCVGRDFATPP